MSNLPRGSDASSHCTASEQQRERAAGVTAIVVSVTRSGAAGDEWRWSQ